MRTGGWGRAACLGRFIFAIHVPVCNGALREEAWYKMSLAGTTSRSSLFAILAPTPTPSALLPPRPLVDELVSCMPDTEKSYIM